MKTRKIGAVILGASVILGVTACTITPKPDEIVMHYHGGSIEGNSYDKVVNPGTMSWDWNVSDANITLPTSLRYWKIAPAETGVADRTNPIVAPAKVEDDQGGVMVNVWLQASFILNTNYDDIEGYEGGTLRQFWERIGHRLDANTEDGWRRVLRVTVDTLLEKTTQEVVSSYDADDLNYNREVDGVLARTAAQREIGMRFNTELKRQTGGDYFCGPTYVPTWSPENVEGVVSCPPVELLITDVDYSNPDIQKARDGRQTAIENAAAELEEAQGKLAAQEALNDALNDPNYLQYLIAQMNLEAAQACASSANCVLVTGGDPNVNVNVPN